MDVITLKNMDFFGHTGVLPEEKENGQLFTVTAELFSRSKPIKRYGTR